MRLVGASIRFDALRIDTINRVPHSALVQLTTVTGHHQMMCTTEEHPIPTEQKVVILGSHRATYIALTISGERVAPKETTTHRVRRHRLSLGGQRSNGLLSQIVVNLRDVALVHHGKFRPQEDRSNRQKHGYHRIRELLFLSLVGYAYIAFSLSERLLGVVPNAIQTRVRAIRDLRHLLDALATRLDHPMSLLLALIP